MRQIPQSCLAGNHALIEIYRDKHSWDESYKVVRWCRECGSVVVDEEFDGRTYPGRIMKMKHPEITIRDGKK